MSKARATGNRLADVAEAEDAKRLAGEFRPKRRCWRADGPLAVPFTVPKPGVERLQVSRQRQHRADDIFGDANLVSIGVGKKHSRLQRATVDPIEPGAGHLDQAEATAGIGHRLRETHRDEDVSVSECRQDFCLIARDDLAGVRQSRADLLRKSHGERSCECDLHLAPLLGADCGGVRSIASMPRRCHYLRTRRSDQLHAT